MRRDSWIGLAALLLLVACTGQSSPPPTSGPAPVEVSVGADRDGVFTVLGGQRNTLAAPNQATLAKGDGVDVDEGGAPSCSSVTF